MELSWLIKPFCPAQLVAHRVGNANPAPRQGTSLLLRSVSDPSARAPGQHLSTTLGRFRLWHIALRVTKRGKPEGERDQKNEHTNTAVDQAHIPGLCKCQAAQ